ncbi:beta strand repeat-containing protein [Desulfonatronum thioautotrophicum]|uniref:beta strand repeat-containing protein n=1 Tax=Desulfonatronum thioautotrophicum TaxID=617001 RepID=UPI0005EBE08F|nr:PEP-CTERM sorting domain-containing protein [Desulfonatronum thioautotrophicum]
MTDHPSITPRITFLCFSLLMFFALIPFFVSPASALDITWRLDGTGDWYEAGNWDPQQVPVAGNNALINNGGTAQAGQDVAVSSLRIGLPLEPTTGSTATGTVTVNGNLTSSFTTVGFAAGVNNKATGTLKVKGEVTTSGLSVGNTGQGPDILGSFGTSQGNTATGTLTVGKAAIVNDSLTIGRARAQDSKATGTATFEDSLSLTTSSFALVGEAVGTNAQGIGTLTVEGALTNTPGSTSLTIGRAAAGAAEGTLKAGSMTFSGPTLDIGRAEGMGKAEGSLVAGPGTLTFGNVRIGLVNSSTDGTADGYLELGGELVQGGGTAPNFVDIGSVLQFDTFNAVGQGTAIGKAQVQGLRNYTNINVGLAAGNTMHEVTATGTLEAGSGGIGGELTTVLNIGRVEGTPLGTDTGLTLWGPGGTAYGTVTVNGGNVNAAFVNVGLARNFGTAEGELEITGGTLTGRVLNVGRTLGEPNIQIEANTNPAHNAHGTVRITDGAIVLTPQQNAESILFVGVGQGFPGATPPTATGLLELRNADLSAQIVDIGGGSPDSTGTLLATQSNLTLDNGRLSIGRGQAEGFVNLTDSSLTVIGNREEFRGGLLVGLNQGHGSLEASNSAITLEGDLGVASFVTILDVIDGNIPARGEVHLRDGSSLAAANAFLGGGVGGNALMSLENSSADITGAFRLANSSSNLFSEASLELDASLLTAGDFYMDQLARTYFAVAGLTRGLGGYGAITVAREIQLNGALEVDFAKLAQPSFTTFNFDLITATSLVNFSDFTSVQLMNIPTGYIATSGGLFDQEQFIYRVTLTSAQVIPEPSTILLLLLGSGVLAFHAMRHRKKASH